LLPPPLPHGKPEPAVEPPPLPARSRADKPAETAPPPPPASPKIEELRHRLEKEPNPRLFAQLAEELRKVGDHAEAIRVCREGVERSPAYPSLRLTLGRALLESGDLPAARAELEAVLQAAPDNIVAERSLGECLEAMGDRAGARARYLKALALAPGDAQLVARLRSLHAGDVPMPPPAARDGGRGTAGRPRRARPGGAPPRRRRAASHRLATTSAGTPAAPGKACSWTSPRRPRRRRCPRACGRARPRTRPSCPPWRRPSPPTARRRGCSWSRSGRSPGPRGAWPTTSSPTSCARSTP